MTLHIAYRLPLVDLRALFGMTVKAVWQFAPLERPSLPEEWVGQLGSIHARYQSQERLARCGLATGAVRFSPATLEINSDAIDADVPIVLSHAGQTVVADEDIGVRLDIDFALPGAGAADLKALVARVLALEAVLIEGRTDVHPDGPGGGREYHPALGLDLPLRFADMYGRETARHSLGRRAGSFEKGSFWEAFRGWQRLIKPGEPQVFISALCGDGRMIEPLATENPLYRSDRGLDLHAVDLEVDGIRQLVWVFVEPSGRGVDPQHVRSQTDRIVGFLCFLERFVLIHRLIAANRFDLEACFKAINLPADVWDQVSVGSADLEYTYRKLTRMARQQHNLKTAAKDLRTAFFANLALRNGEDFETLGDRGQAAFLGPESRNNLEEIMEYAFSRRLRHELRLVENPYIKGMILMNTNNYINIGGQQVVNSENVTFNDVIAAVDSTVNAVQRSEAADDLKAHLGELAALIKDLEGKAEPADAARAAADFKQLSDEAVREQPAPEVLKTFAGRLLSGLETAVDVAVKAKPVINLVLVACGVPPLP